MGSLTIARESRCATCWSLGPEESLLPDPLLRSSWLEAKCIGQTPPLANSKIRPPHWLSSWRTWQSRNLPFCWPESWAGQVGYLLQDLESWCHDWQLEWVMPTEGVSEAPQSCSHQLDSRGSP